MPTLQRREDNSTGTIVGIIAGVVVLVIIFGIMICWATSSHQKSCGYRARRNVVHEPSHHHDFQMPRLPAMQHHQNVHHMPLHPQMLHQPHVHDLQHHQQMQQHQQHMDPIQIQRLHLNVNNQSHDHNVEDKYDHAKQRTDKQSKKRERSEDRSTRHHSPRRHRRRRSGARTSADIEEWMGHVSHQHQHDHQFHQHPHHQHQHQHHQHPQPHQHHQHHRSREPRSDRATLGQDSGTHWFNNDPFADLHLAYPARSYFPQRYSGYH